MVGAVDVQVNTDTHRLIRESRRPCSVCRSGLIVRMWQPNEGKDRSLVMTYGHDNLPVVYEVQAGSYLKDVSKELHKLNGTGL